MGPTHSPGCIFPDPALHASASSADTCTYDTTIHRLPHDSAMIMGPSSWAHARYGNKPALLQVQHCHPGEHVKFTRLRIISSSLPGAVVGDVQVIPTRLSRELAAAVSCDLRPQLAVGPHKLAADLGLWLGAACFIQVQRLTERFAVPLDLALTDSMRRSGPLSRERQGQVVRARLPAAVACCRLRRPSCACQMAAAAGRGCRRVAPAA